jgi:hypothetical protein
MPSAIMPVPMTGSQARTPGVMLWTVYRMLERETAPGGTPGRLVA